jgi:DNA end-binding protein Ku
MGWNPGDKAEAAGGIKTRAKRPAPRLSTAGRAIWSGAISIGLVNVPVRLHRMVRDNSFSFHLLHKSDGQPLKYERVCTRDGVVVPWEETVKGYEVRRGEFLVFDRSELAAVMPESDRRIRIDRFVHYLSLDPVHFETPYILTPDGGSDAYNLLLSAFQDEGRAGVGRITLRTKEYPVVVHAYHGGLVLTTLRYGDEVLDPAGLEELSSLPEPDARELGIARKIITDLSGEFDIREYHDTVRDRIFALIEKKLAGEKLVIAETPKKEEAKELMAALEETLATLRKQ